MYLIDLSNRQNTIFENHFGKAGFYGGKKRFWKKDFQESILVLSFCSFGKWGFLWKGFIGFLFKENQHLKFFLEKGSFMVILGKKYEVYFQGDEKFHGLLENECQF